MLQFFTSETWIQLMASAIGTAGFAVWFNIKGRQVWYSGVGAFITWATYKLVMGWTDNVFTAALVASMFVALYAHIMARVNKAPATIFLVASIFPLIPGAALYYMCYGIVMDMPEFAKEKGAVLLETCLAIAVGFILVEVVMNYYNINTAKLRNFIRKKKGLPPEDPNADYINADYDRIEDS